MSRTLILTRHGKSSWDTPAQEDFDRPLSGRGRRSAAAIGAWLATEGIVPGEAIVSGARRTVETWEQAREALGIAVPMVREPALYHGGTSEMMATLRSAATSCVMMIGHNPTIAFFAARIVAVPPPHPRFDDYPTGATTVVDFDAAAWSAVDWGQGRARAFVIPRELLGDPDA